MNFSSLNLSQQTKVSPVSPSTGVFEGIGIEGAQITSGFWAEMQTLNQEKMIEHCETWMERLGWIENFDQAGLGIEFEHAGREFSDSDVYKLVEAMAWELGREPNEELNDRYKSLVRRIASAQEPDGYLNTVFGREWQKPRYSDLEWGHELYCFGHLFQAAVARLRTHSQDLLVEVAIRAADHVCEMFGPNGIQSVCGHAEIEPALVELGRATGNKKYIDQARIFVERRGNHVLQDIEFGREYFQDDEPIRDSTILRGHAVRATYLAAGAIDVSVETNDQELLDSVEKQVRNTIARRTYITGGMGSHHEGESFGDDFELPSERAYSETCAGVGSIMANHRLLLATGDPFFADQIERTLYNVIATSPSENGDSFFYSNPLQRSKPGKIAELNEVSPRASSSLRAPWFAVSCCPTNVARTVASLSAYVAATQSDSLIVTQYVSGLISAQLPLGKLQVKVTTDYPYSGTVYFNVIEAPEAGSQIKLRIPSWVDAPATIRINSKVSQHDAGWACVEVKIGDEFSLELPMGVRVIEPHDKIDALRKQIAFEQGPLVLCVEQSADAQYSVNDLKAIEVIDGQTSSPKLRVMPTQTPDAKWPFGDQSVSQVTTGKEFEVPLIPYHRWANNGPSTMRIWMPVL